MVHRTPNQDVETINLSLFGQFDRADTAFQTGLIRFRNNTAGSIPTGVWSTSSFSCAVSDAYDWASLGTNWSSFRVLGLKVQVVSHIQSATDGGTDVRVLGAPPLFSAVIRDNTDPVAYPDIMDCPNLQWHPISTAVNQFSREMKMSGVDEAEWVDISNAQTGISPTQPLLSRLAPEIVSLRGRYTRCKGRGAFSSVDVSKPLTRCSSPPG